MLYAWITTGRGKGELFYYLIGLSGPQTFIAYSLISLKHFLQVPVSICNNVQFMHNKNGKDPCTISIIV